VIRINCYSVDMDADCPPIGGVRDGTSEQDALRKLGSPAEQSIDGVIKTLRFPHLGVRLRLRQEQVFSLGVYDPQPNR
jgi:hypothetical protein